LNGEQSVGKAKTERTQALIQAARRRVIAEEASNAIEQHNFDRMVKNGVIRRDEIHTRD
jgi:predicted ribosome quality control (RQC) complex YloA/Tae2 family protein